MPSTFFEVFANASDVPQTEELMASLNSIKNEIIELDEDTSNDLLLFGGNLFVAGQVNKNDDLVSIEDAIQYANTFKRKFIDIEHNRKTIVGFIENVFFTDLTSSEIITEEQVKEQNKPFNVAIQGYIWKKAVGKKLAEFLVAASNEGDPSYNKVSLSFEYAFDFYSIHTVDKDTGEIVAVQEKDIKNYDKLLRKNKGKGFDAKGNRVIRKVEGEQQGSGAGLVAIPAANVRGLVVIDNHPEEGEETSAAQPVKDSQPSVLSVTHNKSTKKFMFKTLEELKANWEEISKQPEAFASVTSFLSDEIKKKSDEFEIALKAKEDAAKAESTKATELAASLKEAQEKLSKQEAEFTKVNEKLAAIEAQQEIAARQEKFNGRMAEFDSIFDLADEDRKSIKDDLLNLTEEAYASYKDKMKGLMKEKTKAYKAEKKGKMKEVLEKKNIKASLESDDVSEIFASIEVTTPSNGVTTSIEPNTNLRKDLKEAFAKGIEVSTK